MSEPSTAALVLWACLLACSGGGSAGKGGGLSLEITQVDASFETLHFEWTPSTPPPSAYTLEAILPSGARWVAREVPGTETAADVVVPLELLGEMASVEFQIRASSGPPSAPVRFRRGLRPPEDLVLWFGGPPFELRWMNRSLGATALVVERRRVVCGTMEEWRTVATLPIPGAFVDTSAVHDWTDGAVLEYRIHNETLDPSTSEIERSATVGPVSTRWADLVAPTFLAVEPVVGGARLTFANQSACATELMVQRQSLRSGVTETIATLPSATVEYVDRSAAPGAYTYQLEARRAYGVGQVNGSPMVSRTGLAGAPASARWEVSAVSVPPGLALARAPSGAWSSAARLGGFPFGAPVFIASGGEDRVLEPASGGTAFAPGIVLDPEGGPHAVYAGPADPVTGRSPIAHAWHDGAWWRTEEVASRPFSGSDATQVIRVAVGLDGTVHASWQAGPDPALGLEVASRRAGGWELENLATALGPSAHVRWMDHVLAADDAGQPHVVVRDGDGTLRHIRKGTAGWTIETIPQVTAVPSGRGIRAVGGAGAVAVAYLGAGSDGTAYTVELVTWTSDGWVEPEALGEVAMGGTIGQLEIARSADGQRFAVAVNRVETVDGGMVWVRGAGLPEELRFFDLPEAFAVGFRPDGRVWLVTGARQYVPGTDLREVDAALFEQP